MKIISKKQALDYFKSGKTIVFPTETSYGLGCDATNQEAVDRIFKIKGRRNDKPLLVVVPTVEMAKEYLEWSVLLQNLADKYWPGALTVVGKGKRKKEKGKSSELVNGVISKDGTAAVRVSNADIPKYLSEKLNRPVVATSANLADVGDVYDAAEIIKMYEGKDWQPDVIIDNGILPKNPPTTIVSVVGEELKVLRQGAVQVESL
ncbi:MAG: L-threonylcarbamoyladenylate synthase [Candidatus Magasanikiibacteriota bacterium]